jgi:hypothetical protein
VYPEVPDVKCMLTLDINHCYSVIVFPFIVVQFRVYTRGPMFLPLLKQILLSNDVAVAWLLVASCNQPTATSACNSLQKLPV